MVKMRRHGEDGGRVKTQEPDKRWRLEAERRGFTVGRGARRHRVLKNTLLALGGWAACIPPTETEHGCILDRGRRFSGRSSIIKGEPSRCHSNSAAIWDANRDKCSICTGYALSRDGMWRQHTWVATSAGDIVETTVRRVCYFGYVLSEEESEEFLECNP